MKPAKTLLIAVLIAVVYLLHQDSWNWKRLDPLIFGFLPIGLAYHAAYSILAAILMAVLVKLAWPKHLETTQDDSPDQSKTKTGEHR